MNQTTQICLIGMHQGAIPDDVVVVDSDHNYVTACQGIRAGKCSVIWARTRVHFEWMKAYTALIGLEASFVIKTPRLLLADAWQVDVPDWLEDGTVEEQGLLQIEVPNGHPRDFARTALVTLFGDVFTSDRLTETGVIQAIQALTAPPVPELRAQYPVLDPCLADCCEQWRSAGQEPWVEMACGQLQSQPEHLQKDLTHYVLLGGYPDRMLGFTVTLQQAKALRSMDRAALSKMSLHALGISDSVEQVSLFFNDVAASVTDEGEFLKVLQCTSGLLAKEFDLLHGILTSGKFAVTEGVVVRVQEHFGPGRVVSRVKLGLLKNLVVPPRPQVPAADAEWDWQEWLAWIGDEYLPYHHWQHASHQFDPEIEAVVARFSDWYVSAYESIHATPERSIVHALTTLTEQIMQDEMSLVFIIDCLPYTFTNQFTAAFTSAGFHRHDAKSVCALLPTFTEVCKPLLISGQWDADFSSYEKAVEHRGKQAWPGKTVRYFGGDLSALRGSGQQEEQSVLVLNYLPGDETLHADVLSAGSTYEEELHRIYSRLADAAREVFGRCNTQADKFGVYVLTDHGATRILAEETDSIDSAVVKKLFPTEKHRFASIEDGDIGSIPANLWDFGYRFKQPFLDSTQTYFIPSGHNTIRAGVPKGYVHGGATPEEVIVPVMTWRPVAVPWKAPSSRFVGLSLEAGTAKSVFYVKRMITLKIELQNPNAKPMAVERVDVLDPVADVRRSSTGPLAPGKTMTVEVECSFDAAALRADELAVQITYSIEGAQQVTDCRTAASFKSAVTGGFSLKNL